MKKQLGRKLFEKIKSDIEKGAIEKAIARLEGSFCAGHRATHPKTRNFLARLLIQHGDLKKAGRYLFLKENPSPLEQKAIAIFVKSLGNDPFLIAKKLIHKENYCISALDEHAKKVFAQLIVAGKQKHGCIPKFLQGVARHLKKIETIKAQNKAY